jgi:hypothetical protein
MGCPLIAGESRLGASVARMKRQRNPRAPLFVMRGLDPRIQLLRRKMDRRIKSGDETPSTYIPLRTREKSRE